MPTDGPTEIAPDLVHDRRPHWRIVVRLAWPVLIQQFLIQAVALYDTFLAGNNIPTDSSKHEAYQAAQGTANYIAWFLSSCTSLVAVGGTALVARFVGAGNHEGAVRATNQSILLAVLFGLIATPFVLAIVPGGIGLLGLTGDAAEAASHFLRPILTLLTCQLITQAGIACLVGAGDTRTGPVILSGVAILNIPLAWACYHGLGPIPAMEFFGIGVGTATSHAIGSLAMLAVLTHGRYGLRLKPALLVPDPAIIYRLLRVSVPASIDSLSLGLCQLWFLSLVNGLGEVAAAAHGMAIRCEGLGYMSGWAFAVAASALVGQNLGARRPRDATHAAWVALGIGCLVMSCMGVLFFTLAPEMLHFLSPHKDQQPIVDAGVPVLRLVAFAMPPLSAIIVLTGVLRGAGDTRYPILLTWIGFLAIRIPLAYLLTRSVVDLGPVGSVPGWDMGLIGAWIAMFADLLIRGVLFFARFLGGRWKAVRV